MVAVSSYKNLLISKYYCTTPVIFWFLVTTDNYKTCDQYDDTTTAEVTDVEDQPDTSKSGRRRPHLKRSEDFLSWSAGCFDSCQLMH